VHYFGNWNKSIRHFVRMEHLGSQRMGIHGILYLSIFRKSVDNIQVQLKSDKNKWYLTWIAKCIYNSTSWSSENQKFFRQKL
jgi:hypothetical protein